MKINQLYEAKTLAEIPVCPQERLVIISNITVLSFALERIGPLAAIIIIVSYLLILYLSALSKNPKNLFASIYSDSLIKTACQHLLILVGFDTLIYRKYYDTPSILVGHQSSSIPVDLSGPYHFSDSTFLVDPTLAKEDLLGLDRDLVNKNNYSCYILLLCGVSSYMPASHQVAYAHLLHRRTQFVLDSLYKHIDSS
jgi:hypothetical protein